MTWPLKRARDENSPEEKPPAENVDSETEPQEPEALAARLEHALSTRVPPDERRAERELCDLLEGEALARQLSKLEARASFHWLDADAGDAVQTLLKGCALTPAQRNGGLTAALVELKKAELSGGRYSPAQLTVGEASVSAFSVIAEAFTNQPRPAFMDPAELAAAGTDAPAGSAESDYADKVRHLRAKYPDSFKD